MDIRQLRAFVTLSECLSYREAAERLWLTQPTLTKQIKMLETEISLVLFLRDNHGTQLSRHGQQLYQDAKKLLSQFNAFKTLCQQLTNGKRGALSLWFISSATPVMPAIITAFQNAFPDIYLGLQDISSPLAFRKTGSDCLTLVFHKSCRHQQEPLHQLWRRCTLFTVNAETCPGSALQINNFIAAHGIDARKMQCISDTRTLMTRWNPVWGWLFCRKARSRCPIRILSASRCTANSPAGISTWCGTKRSPIRCVTALSARLPRCWRPPDDIRQRSRAGKVHHAKGGRWPGPLKRHACQAAEWETEWRHDRPASCTLGGGVVKRRPALNILRASAPCGGIQGCETGVTPGESGWRGIEMSPGGRKPTVPWTAGSVAESRRWMWDWYVVG